MDSWKHKQVSLESVMPTIRQELEQGRSVRLWPKGISMLPMLRQGVDSVILSPLPEKLKKYDVPLYRRKNGQYVLHRVIRVDSTYTCLGDNQFQQEPGLDHGQMIGLVTGFYRGERYWSVRAWQYWLYCRMLPAIRVLRRIRGKCGALLRRLRK